MIPPCLRALAALLPIASALVVAPSAQAQTCETFQVFNAICASAHAHVVDTGSGYYYTSDGSGSASFPAMVTMATSPTADGQDATTKSCIILPSGSCGIHAEGLGVSSCDYVSVRTAILVTGAPAVTDYAVACAGGNLIDPVGLALDTTAQASNAINQAVFG